MATTTNETKNNITNDRNNNDNNNCARAVESVKVTPGSATSTALRQTQCVPTKTNDLMDNDEVDSGRSDHYQIPSNVVADCDSNTANRPSHKEIANISTNMKKNDEHLASPTNASSPTVPPTGNSITSPATSSNSYSRSDSSPATIRERIGHMMEYGSRQINDNLVIARWGISSTIALLTIYGVSQTPLFFRYTSIHEIPASMFLNRSSLSVRLVRPVHPIKPSATTVTANVNATTAVTLHVQHLTLVSRWFLSRDAWRWMKRIQPKTPQSIKRHLSLSNIGGPSSLGKTIDIEQSRQAAATNTDNYNVDDDDGIMTIELAGITSPPPTSSSLYQAHQQRLPQLLDSLVKDEAQVKIQLLGRKNVQVTNDQFSSATSPTTMVCKLYYRPSMWSIIPTDIALPLVRHGQVMVLDGEFFVGSTTVSPSTSSSSTDDKRSNNRTQVNDNKIGRVTIEDASNDLADIRNDVKYLERLNHLELDAIKGQHGLWSDPSIRSKFRPEVVEELEFQSSATIAQKVWRWITRRW